MTMKRTLMLLIAAIFSLATFAQSKVNLSEAASALMTTVNTLNTLYYNFDKQDAIDPDIKQAIYEVNNLVMPCREKVVDDSYSMNVIKEEAKRAAVYDLCKTVESKVTGLDKSMPKEVIIATLTEARDSMKSLAKQLGIKIKKSKKK